jgi:hypothetical protein
VACDRRGLSVHEVALCQFTKLTSLGLSSLQCTIARQESRVLWISEGDASTRFFHVHANSRRRWHCIHTLEHQGHVLVARD